MKFERVWGKLKSRNFFLEQPFTKYLAKALFFK